MPAIEIQLPSLMDAVTGGQRELRLEADTLAAALQTLRAEHTTIAVHFFDEAGGFRPHVLCFHNGTNLRWLTDLEVPLADGDTLLFMQAVTGG